VQKNKFGVNVFHNKSSGACWFSAQKINRDNSKDSDSPVTGPSVQHNYFF